MRHTDHDLTYLKHGRDDAQIGENWDLAEVDFGPERYSITTDHVHASEFAPGDPEADVLLWSKAPRLLDTIKHAHRRLMETYTPETATPLHEELLPLLRDALASVQVPA